MKHIVNLPTSIEMRFDKYLRFQINQSNELTKIFGQIKQSLIEQMIRKKFVKINQNKINQSNFIVQNNDLIEIDEYFISALEKKNNQIPNSSNNTKTTQIKNFDHQIIQEIKKNIIFEDENLLILNKQAGIAVQSGHKVKYSLDEILNYIYLGICPIKITHRIDQYTSGIIIFAKNLLFAQKITRVFARHEMQKTYLAIGCGHANFINKSIENYLCCTTISGEEKIMISQNSSQGKFASSNIRCIENFIHQEKKFCLLEVKPKTGRKHQIRTHLSSIGIPILGDEKYNNLQKNLEIRQISKNKMFLHAWKIDNEELDLHLQAPIPEYFKNLINIDKIINILN